MAFTKLSEYSEGVFPECGTADHYTICENIGSYKPFDVSGLKGVVDKALDSAFNTTKSNNENLSKKVDNLSNEWGVKFIAINDKDLNIVDPNNYSTNYTSIDKNLEEQKSRCEEIVNTIISKTEKVNNYIEKIENNNKNYKQTKKELIDLKDAANSYRSSISYERSKETPSFSKLSALQAKLKGCEASIRTTELEIEKYESARIDSPDGSWVLG